jgi:fructose-1,6-bisphosphatase I
MTPEAGKIFSYNEGNLRHFTPPVQAYLERCRDRDYSSRYIGALVGDFHRNLLKGGIYLYPGTKSHPDGKLRLLYECYPLAWLVEQAGGMATSGGQRILSVPLQSLHQRSPLFVGSKNMVEELESLITNKTLASPLISS